MSFNSIAAFSNCPDVDLDWLNWPNLTTCLFWEFSISLTITFSLAKVVFLTPGEGTTSIGWNPGCPRTPQVTSKVCYQKTKPNCICFPQFFNHIFLPYMCAIPACEEFITEFCEFPFLSPNSVHASSPFSVNHIFFTEFSDIFVPYFFVPVTLHWISELFSTDLITEKKTFFSSPLNSKFPLTDFGESNNSSLICVKKQRPILLPNLKKTSPYSAKNL